MLVSDIEPLVKDWCRNQNLTNDRFLRAFNQAANLVFTQLGLPSQEEQYIFGFDECQHYYDLPEDFLEPLWMRFEKDKYNRRPFEFTRPIYIYPKINQRHRDTREWSLDYETGSPRLIVLARNTHSYLEIDDFDNSAANWVASQGCNSLYNDSINYVEGAGSMGFDITVPTINNQGQLTTTVSTMDISEFLNVGEFKVAFDCVNITDFTSVTFQWMTDSGDYYTSTVTTQQDGTPFVVGWNYLSFDWSTATQVGTPDPSAINIFQFFFNFDSSYTGGSYFHLDNLRLVIPDQMIMTYYKQTPTYALTDEAPATNIDAGIANMFAIYTAVIINPQILVDDKQAQEQYQYWTNFYQRRFPKRRINNLLVNPKISKTN
jgi:hypothetical protein